MKFKVGDRVIIKLPDIEGMVIGVFNCDNYLTYSVVYWNNGERLVESLVECEIENKKYVDNPKIGFYNEN